MSRASPIAPPTESQTKCSADNPKSDGCTRGYDNNQLKGFQGNLNLLTRRWTIPIISFLAFSMMLFPMIMIHETAHVLVCDYFGGRGNQTSPVTAQCYGNTSHLAWVRFAGGASASAASSVPLILRFRLKHHAIYRAVVIASLTFAVWEFEKAMLEPFYYDFYETIVGDLVMSMGALAAGIGLYFALGRSKNITRGWPKPKPKTS
jgi:hypothetical protein